MKKQINPNIKAHLIRGSFYVLLLLAVCVIPFALAQRNTTRQSAARTAASPKVAGKTVANPKLAPHATSLVGKGSATASRSTYFSRAPRKVSTQPTGVCTDIVNGGFETGDLPPWTDTGDTSFTGVDGNPHSGTSALFSGPSTSDGFIDQILPTADGTAYDVSFWLENDDSSGSNRFGASIGGIILVPEAAQSAFGYTQ